VIECKDAVTYLRESYKYHRRQVSFRLSKREADDGDALKYEDKVQWEFLLQKNNVSTLPCIWTPKRLKIQLF